MMRCIPRTKAAVREKKIRISTDTKGFPTESTISIQKIGFSTDTRSFLEENQKKISEKMKKDFGTMGGWL